MADGRRRETRWSGLGLQTRLLLGIGLGLALLAIVLALLLQRQVAMQRETRILSGEIIHGLFEHEARARAESMAKVLAEVAVDPRGGVDRDETERLARSLARERLVNYARLYDSRGRLLADTGGGVAERPEPLALAAISADATQLRSIAGTLHVAVPMKASGRLLGSAQVGVSLAQIGQVEAVASGRLHRGLEQFGQQQRGWLILLLAGLVAAGAVVAFYLQRTLVAPILRLAGAARRIDSGEGAVHSRGDELGELLHTFGRLSQSIQRQGWQVRQMARTDALTGLLNRSELRRQLEQRLEAVIASGGQLALLFVDVDDFKRVNDSLGHEAGDQVLLQFAARIDAVVREWGGDEAVLARFGGDEFVVLLQIGEVSELAIRLAERLLHELRRPSQVLGREVFLAASIGIVLLPDDAADAATLLKKGDIAMNQAKLAGKNCHRFYSLAMDRALKRRMHLQQELRGAWGRGELHLVYQPIHRMSDRMMVGVEVLLRWQHPTLGAIAPSTFINVAEQGGLIEDIGAKVLRAACVNAMQWPCRQGHPELFISVNVSPRQLRGGELIDLVAACLADSGLPSSRLHLELTETAVIGDEMLAVSQLDRLHRMGIEVWLDDFGTGFSELRHLRQASVDGVKIDKSFVADLPRDVEDLALTSAIIAMAHSLGIEVVAEGIEQQAQFELLRERGCELGQGYWFNRPLSNDELVRVLRS